MNLENEHPTLAPSHTAGPRAPTATDVLTRRDAPTLAVAVSWYADVTLHRFAYVGPMVARLLGFPTSAWKEDGFWAMHLPADERESIQLRRKQHVDAGTDFELNYHMISSDGTYVRIREMTTVTRLDDGSVVLRGLFLRNDSTPFTGPPPAAVTSFVSWMSHELSQPIGVVLANLDAMRHMLRASPPRVDEALEALADVAQSARDAASLLAVVRRSIRSADSPVNESDQAQ